MSGVKCVKCTSPNVTVHARTVHCNSCGHTANVNTMIQAAMKPARPQGADCIGSPQDRSNGYQALGNGGFWKRPAHHA